MDNYIYYGRDRNGHKISGELHADTINEVLEYLSSKQITPVNINKSPDIKGVQSLTSLVNFKLFDDKVKKITLIMFFKQMHTLIRSGVPIIKAINTLAVCSDSKRFSSVLSGVSDCLQSGTSLTVAFSKYPHVFSNLVISLVKIGEETGRLESTFLQLSQYFVLEDETKKSILKSVRYPIFVVISILIAIIVVNYFVIPSFSDLFAKFSLELPLLTKYLLSVSELFTVYHWRIIFTLFAVILIFMVWFNSREGRYQCHRLMLYLPFFGNILYKFEISKYMRCFSLMVGSGVSLMSALTYCSQAVGNQFIARKIEEVKSGVENGDSILNTHNKSELFSPLVIQMISVGEESGELCQLLDEVADYYEQEIQYDVNNLSAKIEPCLILLLSIFVTILALGIFIPMWDIYSIQ